MKNLLNATMRKVFVILFLLSPVALFAQNKVAHINTQEIFALMPEIPGIEKQLADLSKQYDDELRSNQEEYQKKLDEYKSKEATMLENIKATKLKELDEMGKRITAFVESAKQDIARRQQELVMPLQKKIQDAIDKVAREQGYDYVFDVTMGTLVFVGDQAIDATPLVKTKLGIKPDAKPAAPALPEAGQPVPPVTK